MKSLIILANILLLYSSNLSSQVIGNMSEQLNNIISYEYWFDGNYNEKVAVSITPENQFYLIDNINIDELPGGMHIFNIRFEDEENKYSSTMSQFIFKNNNITTADNLITSYRYWFDDKQDSIIHKYLQTPSYQYPLLDSIEIGTLDLGNYYFHIQFQDTASNWSGVLTSEFLHNPSFVLNVFLEGTFDNMLMKTDLNNSNLLQLEQPFNTPPWNYDENDSVVIIPNTEIVDWILIELRESVEGPDSATSDTRLARKAAFLLNDGSIVGLDGHSKPEFEITVSSNVYAVIWHRNHLGIMSAYELPFNEGVLSFDFTTGTDKVFGGDIGYKELVPGIWGMVSGDGDTNSTIDIGDKDAWSLKAGESGYKNEDFNLNGEVANPDKNDYSLPNDGKESQVPD